MPADERNSAVLTPAVNYWSIRDEPTEDALGVAGHVRPISTGTAPDEERPRGNRARH